MAEYLAVQTQAVNLNEPIVFDASIPCTKGYVYHEDGTGVFTLRGITNQCFATYVVTFNGNIAVPEGGAVTPIAISIVTQGEVRPSSKAIFTPAAVSDFGNVTSHATVKVPRGCCFSLAVEYVSAVTEPTDTPTPIIEVANANLTISRTA